MTIDFCKKWSDEECKMFLDVIRKRKIEYCEKHGLPVPPFDKVEDFYVETEMLTGREPAGKTQPLTIKNFKVGQTAFIVGGDIGQRPGKAATGIVKTVGRKYVTVKAGARELRFEEHFSGDCPYLTEHTDYGAGRLLFPSSEAVDDYCELDSLRGWLRRESDWQAVKKYTLAQLRAVKWILEGGEQP